MLLQPVLHHEGLLICKGIHFVISHRFNWSLVEIKDPASTCDVLGKCQIKQKMAVVVVDVVVVVYSMVSEVYHRQTYQ